MKHIAAILTVLGLFLPSISVAKIIERPPEYTEGYSKGRLADYSYGQLVGYLTLGSQNYHSRTYGKELPTWEMAAELRNRGQMDKLLATYANPVDAEQRESILRSILYKYDWNKRIADAVRKTATKDATETAYYSNMYLAKRGDVRSLGILNENWGKYTVSSSQWSYTVKVIGEQKFMPAVDNLIDLLDKASLDVVDEVLAALMKIFPDADPPTEEGIQATKEYFQELVKRTEIMRKAGEGK
jgi:hypothetical protein